jgi:hypothetical protein
MTAKNKSEVPKKIVVDSPESSPMGKFHKAMKKIVSVPKSKQKS